MREKGKVVHIEQEKVSLILETDADCELCGMRTQNGGMTGCATCSLFGGEKKRTLSAVNRHHLQLAVGDRVIVTLHPGKAVFAAFLFFILPLLLFLGGYGIAATADPALGEVGKVLVGLGGFVFAYCAVILIRVFRKTKDWPEIVAKEEIEKV